MRIPILSALLVYALLSSSALKASCDYSAAAINGGWGWNSPTSSSCPPVENHQATDGLEPQGISAGCDYAYADLHNGWGWNNTSGESCPPLNDAGLTQSTTDENPSSGTPASVSSRKGCDTCFALPAYAPDHSQRPKTVHVSQFGAHGSDESEHLAIQRAINAAGVGGRVIFESGRRYFLCQMINAVNGQIWQASDQLPATLKRCAARLTTLAGDVSLGTTYLPVASTKKFEAGMWVTPVLPGRDDFPAGELTHHPIIGVSNTTLKVQRGMERDYPAGSYVVTSFSMVRVGQDVNNVTFEGLIFDGNAQQNDYYLSWARQSSLWLAGEDTLVRHSRFIHSQGEAITVQGLRTRIEYNVFEHLNGSAVHLSNARETTIRGNHILNANQKAERVHHAEAAITWSTSNRNILVDENCIRDTPAAAFGDILAHGRNLGASIVNNQICRTGKLLTASSVEDLSLELSFKNNSVEKTGKLELEGKRGSMLTELEIRKNRMEDSFVVATDTNLLTIADNHFSNTTTTPSIAINGGNQTQVSDNVVKGGVHAIHITNAARNITGATTIDRNTLLQQTDSALLIGGRDTIDSEIGRQSDFRAVSADDNMISSNQITAGRAAVQLGRGASFSDNCIESNAQGMRLHGYTGNPHPLPASITGNQIDSAGISIIASPPYIHGITVVNNSASNGVSPALLNANPQSSAPALLVAGCDYP